MKRKEKSVMTEISSSSSNTSYEIRKNNGAQDSETSTSSEILGSTFSDDNNITVSQSDNVFNNTNENIKKSSEVTIPIGNAEKATAEQDISEVVSSESYKTMTSKQHKLANLRVTKEEISKARAFLDSTAKELGIDPTDIPQKEKDLYMGLSIAYERGLISKEEFIKAVEEFGSEEVTKAVKETFTESTDQVDEKKMQKIRKVINHVGKMRALNKLRIANGIFGKDKEETQRLREEYFLKTAGDVERYHKELMKDIDNALPAGCSEDVRNAAIGTADEIVKSEMNSISTLTKNRGYSDNFQKQLKKTYEQIWTRIIENRQKFIASVSRYLNHKVFIKKLELKERKEIADKKLEEAQIAQANATKAKEKANLIKENAQKMLRWFGVDEDAKKKDKIKFIHDQSPRLFVDGKYAMRAKKYAEEEEYDANAAKRLALKDVEWAEKSLAYASAQRDAFLILMS